MLLLRNRGEAEDVLHETLVIALKSFSKLREKIYFKTWTTRILINQVKKKFRNKPRIISLNENIEVGCFELDEIMVWDEVDKLKPKYKIIIVLKYAKDLSLKEIAEILNCPIGTVKTRLYRALNKLKEILKE